VSEIINDVALPGPPGSGAWRGLVRSVATLVLGETVARVFGLVAVVLLARNLGPAGFGLVAVGMGIVGRLAVVSDSGTELIGVRDVAREPERFRELTEKILGLRLALSLGIAALFVVGVYVFTDPSPARDVDLRFALALPAMALNLRWMVLGIGAERAVAAGNVAARGAFLVGITLLVLPSSAVERVPYAYAAGELVYACILLAAVLPAHGWIVPRVDLRFWGATLRQGLPLLVSSLARGVAPVELLIITAFASSRQAGLYSAGTKPMYFVATLLGLVYVGFIASYSAASADETLGLLRRSAAASLAVSFAAALGLSIAAGTVMPLVFGRTYAAAAVVVAIAVWRLPFSALSTPFNGLLVSAGRQSLLMRNNIIAGVLNVAGALVAMPLVGIDGVAAVSVLAGAAVLALNYRTARREELAPTFRTLLSGAA
jgi:O-antigen/teichoic acid export membrane protein